MDDTKYVRCINCINCDFENYNNDKIVCLLGNKQFKINHVVICKDFESTVMKVKC